MLGLTRDARERAAGGFSLVELMVTIAVAAILLAIAAPSFTQVIADNRAASAANDLLASLQFARSEAVKRARPVSLCPSNDGQTCVSGGTSWQEGWIVFTFLSGVTEILRVSTVTPLHVAVTGPSTVAFQPAGNVILTPGATNFSLAVPGADARSVCLEAGGSAWVTKSEDCS